VKPQKLTVGLFLFAGLLFLIAGLRDIFAPGFFNVSPQVKSRGDIIFEFAAAVTFLTVGYAIRLNKRVDSNKKQ
jgi:predicted ribosome-associated RNA-binding protein Tma20